MEDFLKDFKDFFLNKGFETMIYDFQNPTWQDKFYHAIRFIPEKDAREYKDDSQVEEEPLGRRYLFFIDELKIRMDQMKILIKEHCNDLLVLKEENSKSEQIALNKSECNFNEVRENLMHHQSYSRYQEFLLPYITQIEATFIKAKKQLEVSPLI